MWLTCLSTKPQRLRCQCRSSLEQFTLTLLFSSFVVLKRLQCQYHKQPYPRFQSRKGRCVEQNTTRFELRRHFNSARESQNQPTFSTCDSHKVTSIEPKGVATI